MENAEIFSKAQQNQIINRTGVVELESLKILLDRCLNELNCLKHVVESVLKADIVDDVVPGDSGAERPINKMAKSHKVKKKIVESSRNTKFEGEINSQMHQSISDVGVSQLVAGSKPVKGKGRSQSRIKHVTKAGTLRQAYTKGLILSTPATILKPEVSLNSSFCGNKDQVDSVSCQFSPQTSQQPKKRGRKFGSKNRLNHIINTETLQQGHSLYSKVTSLTPLASVSQLALNTNSNVNGNKSRMESQSDVNEGETFTIVHSLNTHMLTSNSKKDISRKLGQLSHHTLQEPKKRGRKLGSKNRPKQIKTETFQEVHSLYSMTCTLNALTNSQSAVNLSPNIGEKKQQMESQSAQLSSHTSQLARKRGRKLGSKNGPKHINAGETIKQIAPKVTFNTNVDGNDAPMASPSNFSQPLTKYGSKLVTETHIPQRKVIALQQKQSINNLRILPLQYALQHIRGDKIAPSSFRALDLSRDPRLRNETMGSSTVSESLTNNVLSQDIGKEHSEYESFQRFKSPEIPETLDILCPCSDTSKGEIDSKLIHASTTLPSEVTNHSTLMLAPIPIIRSVQILRNESESNATE